MTLQPFWNALANIGIRPHLPERTKRSIRLVNLYCLTILFSISLYAMIIAVEQQYHTFYLIGGLYLLLGLPILFNRLHFYLFASYFFSLLLPMICVFLGVATGPDIGMEYPLFSIGVMIFLIYDKFWEQLGFMLYIAFCAIIIKYAYLKVAPSILFDTHILFPDPSWISLSVIITTLIIFTAYMHIFKQENLRFERQRTKWLASIHQKNTNLLEANEQLKKLNQEISQNNLRIDEQRQHLERINERLNLANEELRSFAYVITHDLREPLNLIHGYGEILKKKAYTKLDYKEQDHLDTILMTTNRMDRFIKDLLNYTKLEQYKESASLVNLKEVVQDVIENLELKIRETGAKLTVRSLTQIKGRKHHLLQLYQNLLENALKFSKEGQAPLIEIGQEEHGENFRLYVKDNGKGIAAHEMELIFMVFQRSSQNSGKIPGSGIGLAICKKIVEQMGGKIWVESQLGIGSTFWIEVPRLETPVIPRLRQESDL